MDKITIGDTNIYGASVRIEFGKVQRVYIEMEREGGNSYPKSSEDLQRDLIAICGMFEFNERARTFYNKVKDLAYKYKLKSFEELKRERNKRIKDDLLYQKKQKEIELKNINKELRSL